jgi:hypothetical protein
MRVAYQAGYQTNTATIVVHIGQQTVEYSF